MKKSFYIGDILVGDENRCVVIPEIGINHEGSLQTAKEMVDAAHRAGARWIKHQTHIVEDEMCLAAKKVIPGNSDDSIYDIMQRCALSREEELALKKYVESLGMVFLSTPFSRAAADRLEEFGVAAYKIGSGELNNYPLIEHVAEFGKPMIVSTGMNDIASISKTVDILERHGVDYALMHTTNLYPTKPEWVRLGAMQEMMREFSHVPIGLSDHTVNNNACIAAMALGADLVERHFTDRMDRQGPDLVCSMDEAACAELIRASKEIPQMRGGRKQALQEEQVTIDFAFATVVTIKPVSAGEVFTKENLWVKRPGTGGIPAEKLGELLGKKAAADIGCDVQLTWEMVENRQQKIPILALIPARGGSKGIPGKNIKELAGRPLISYTIDAAKQAPSISRVIVSTDSREIADIAEECGADVPFLRPPELASDTAKTMDAVMHTLRELEKKGEVYEYLVLLQPTSPLRTAEDIESCIRKALESGKDVAAISETADSPVLMRTCEENGKMSSLLEGTSTIRRQDMPVYYRVNGSVYVNKIERLSASTSLNDNPVGCILPKEHGLDIDEPSDFALAEYYLAVFCDSAERKQSLCRNGEIL